MLILSLCASYCCLIMHQNLQSVFKVLNPFTHSSWPIKKLLHICIAVSCFLLMFIYLTAPDLLFYHPKNHLQIWLSTLVLYPILSVLPQELIYRTFIFNRYQAILPNLNHRILLSCISFGFLHIIFRNWEAVIFSTLAGVIFCQTYIRYQSTLVIILLHSLIGLSAYTIGLGYYFDLSLIH